MCNVYLVTKRCSNKKPSEDKSKGYMSSQQAKLLSNDPQPRLNSFLLVPRLTPLFIYIPFILFYWFHDLLQARVQSDNETNINYVVTTYTCSYMLKTTNVCFLLLWPYNITSRIAQQYPSMEDKIQSRMLIPYMAYDR